nr:MAG TPA: major capsid protein [Caudoviricetes sp.]
MGIASNGGLRGRLVQFNNVDKHGDIIKSVKGDFGKAPLYLEHNKNQKIGELIWSVVEDGVEISAVYDNSDLARAAKNSGRTGLSVGYGVATDDIHGNEHHNIVITEGSLVRNPANELARVTFTKSENLEKEENMKTETELREKELELQERELKLKEDEVAIKKEEQQAFHKSIESIVETLKKEKSGEIKIQDTVEYTKSASAILDFAQTLFDISSPKAFKERWVEKSAEIQREKGIVDPQSLIPAGVLSRFTDAFERPGGLLQHLDISPLNELQVGFDATASTGSYHTMETEKTGVLTPVLRTITPEFFYSFISVPRKVIVMNKANNVNALLDYVLNKLPLQLALGIEQKIVAGKATEAIRGITTDEWAGKGTATDYIQGAKEALKGVIRSRGVILIMSPAALAELKFSQDKNGQLNFPATSTVEQVAAGLGVEEIVAVDNVIMGKTESDDQKAFEDNIIIALSKEGYQVNMQSGFESFQDFAINYNNERFLTEVLIGGSLEGRRRAKVVTITPVSEG